MFDELTAVIAVIGAVTGVGGLTVQIINARRSRSKLQLKVEAGTLLGKPPRRVIDITNVHREGPRFETWLVCKSGED
jgi:hypothetical protein